MPSIGPTELIIVLVIVLLIFGPKRLPGLGRQLGGGMREFKDSISGKGGRDDEEDDREEDADSAERRRKTEAALTEPTSSAGTGTEPTSSAGTGGRPDGEQAPLEGEVVSERRS